MLYEADSLTKVFREHQVLGLENFALEKHKIYALVGPNGAGKTTLLNILAFLDQPTFGKLRFCGFEVSSDLQHLLTLRRRVVLVDQYPILFTGSVLKNVEFGLKVRGVSRKQRERRVHEVLELVQMKDFLLADAHKLSGGESKRVAMARALAIEPEVMLCDEPTANVDVDNQKIILNILEQINSEQKTSIIMSTHYLSQSRNLAHHTLMLDHGKIVMGESECSYECRIITIDSACFLLTVNDRVSLRLYYQQFPDVSGFCRVSINPANIQCIWNSETSSGNKLSGIVICLEQDKETVQLTIDCGIILRVALNTQEYLLHNPAIGDNISVNLPDEAIQIVPVSD